MAQVELLNVWSRPLSGVSLSANNGCHVVVFESEAGGAELVRLLAGVTRPERGSVEVDGEAPHKSPKLRCRIGSLLANEAPLPGKCLEQALERALSRRSHERGFALDFLERAQLSAAKAGPPTNLTPEECRKLALVIALGTPNAKAITLFEPLMFSDAEFRSQMLARIADLGRSIPILCATSSQSDARAIGGAQAFLSSTGVLRPGLSVDEALKLTLGFSVECADPRPLARALTDHPEVTDVHWFQSHSSGVLEARGLDAFAITRAIARAALDTSTVVIAIRPLRRSEQASVLGDRTW